MIMQAGKYLLVIFIVALSGCWYLSISEGHGSIKAYKFPVTKFELEKAVDSVLKKNMDVKRVITYYYYSYDSINKVTSEAMDSTKGSVKVFDSAENDGKRYLTIYITKNDIEYEYTFQYPGTEDDWANSKESVISIAYAYDDKGNGGSDGHGDFNFHWFLKRQLTGIFEGEFIDKVDKRLGKKHMVAD